MACTPVPRFEERDLPAVGDGGVGRDGLVAPAVGVLEQGQRRTGVWVLPADDDPHPGRPRRQVEHAGDLDDVTVLAGVAVGSDGRRPCRLRQPRDRVADLA